jgi:hypothetical protein
MRKVLSVFLLLALGGCASVTIPNYIQDKYPYKRTFYAPFDQVREAAVQTFGEFGWTIGKESEPALFERERESGSSKQTLLFTEIRQTSFFVGSRYARLNAYLRATADHETEVEIRYLTVTSVPFKRFHHYKNDRAIERIFRHIEGKLNL